MKFKLIENVVKSFNKNKFNTNIKKYTIQNPLTNKAGKPILWFRGSNVEDFNFKQRTLDYGNINVFFFSTRATFALDYTRLGYVKSYLISCNNIFDFRDKQNRLELCRNANSFIYDDKTYTPQQFYMYLYKGGDLENLSVEDFTFFNSYDFLDRFSANYIETNKKFAKKQLYKLLYSASDEILRYFNFKSSLFISYNKENTDLTYVNNLQFSPKYENIIKYINPYKYLSSSELNNLKNGNSISVTKSREEWIKICESNEDYTLEEIEEAIPQKDSLTLNFNVKTINLQKLFNRRNSFRKTNIWDVLESTYVITKDNKENTIQEYIKSLGFDGTILTENNCLNIVIYDPSQVEYYGTLYYNTSTKRWTRKKRQ